jgi:hypothetical protein
MYRPVCPSFAHSARAEQPFDAFNPNFLVANQGLQVRDRRRKLPGLMVVEVRALVTCMDGACGGGDGPVSEIEARDVSGPLGGPINALIRLRVTV